MDHRVYVVKCPGYDQVETRMSELLDMMGGMGQFAAPGEKLVLKVNLLMPARPEQAITPHPAVVTAVGRMAKDEGADPVIADSPGSGYPYSVRTLDRVYRTCGMHEAAREAGIGVNLDTTYRAISFPDGELVKRFEVITPVLEADGVIDLCKLKTHTLTGITGAVKNLFGVIPGLSKPGYHGTLQDKERFAGMLLDLAAYVSPRLSIMDAVLGMEGDGPNAGDPRQIGLLLASRSPLAMDIVASEVIGLDRAHNPVLLAAEKRGLYPNRLEEVQIVGPDVADLRVPGFKLPATIEGGSGLGKNAPWWQRALEPLFKDSLTLRPRVVVGRCVACGACRDACPMAAITIVGDGRAHKHAQIDDQACIRCYCCHEMCPHDAIELRKSLLYRLASAW